MTRPYKQILIVDDDRLIVRMLEDLFKDDFMVLTAGDGASALEILRSQKVVAVLCDQMMPKITGVEVLKECASLQPKAVRILVTATEKVEDVRDAVNLARVHRVIVKPFRVLEVGGIVKGAIHEAELERENEALIEELQEVIRQVQKREVELEQELNLRTRELKEVMDHFAKKSE